MGMTTRLIPDLGEELCQVLDQVEKLLVSLQAWEQDPYAPVELPAPLAHRVALDSLCRVRTAIAPTQSRSGGPAPTGGRLLGPNARYEHRPLRLVELWSGDLDVLTKAAGILGRELATRPHSELAAVIAAGARAATPEHGPALAPAWLVEALARAHGVLDLAETDPGTDTATLTALIAAAGETDVILTPAEQHAYTRTAERFNAMWTPGSAIDRLLSKGAHPRDAPPTHPAVSSKEAQTSVSEPPIIVWNEIVSAGVRTEFVHERVTSDYEICDPDGEPRLWFGPVTRNAKGQLIDPPEGWSGVLVHPNNRDTSQIRGTRAEVLAQVAAWVRKILASGAQLETIRPPEHAALTILDGGTHERGAGPDTCSPDESKRRYDQDGGESGCWDWWS